MSEEEKKMMDPAGSAGQESWLDEAAAERKRQEYLQKKKEAEERKITAAKVWNIFYLGIFLFLICASAAVVMGYVDHITLLPREKAREKKLVSALGDVLPPFNNNILETMEKEVSHEDEPAMIFTAKKDGKIVGYAVQTSTGKGYGGKVESLVSFSPEGKIYSFVITAHSETPGLGAEVTDRREVRTFATLFSAKKKKSFPDNLPPGKVLDQFRNRSLEEAPWRLRRAGGNIDGRSGATITSEAVTLLATCSAKVLRKKLQKEGKIK